MENWQLDFEWLQVQHKVKDWMNMEKLPDLNAILYLIGIQELGRVQPKFTKEEKQDLMHIAICELLCQDGYYEFVGRDEDGWPHYELLKPVQEKGEKAQQELLKTLVVRYFQNKINEEQAASDD